MKRHIILSLFFLTTLILGCTQASRNPIESLDLWLEQPASVRGELNAKPFASASLTKEQATEASKKLWTDYSARLRKEYQAEWKAKKIQLDKNVMQFETRIFGETPKDGRSLYISLHGGGGAPAAVNDQQWKNQIGLYQTPPGSVYVAPRAPTNDWDLWHKDHIDDFIDRIIISSVLFEDVNPNKVYLMGYSAGGDGVYQVAPRIADRFAAAAMMAGHPNEASPLGLRNLPFTIWMGKHDGAYKRNEVAVQWGQKLDDLQKQDPDGYIHKLNMINSGHWMNRKDAEAIPWMARYTRNPHPTRVVWCQDDVRHNRFYWLGVPAAQAQAGDEVAVTLDGQAITIEKSRGIEKLIIRLNDDLVDLDKPVTVRQDGKVLFTGTTARTMAVIDKLLQERPDPKVMFVSEITVSPKLETEK